MRMENTAVQIEKGEEVRVAALPTYITVLSCSGYKATTCCCTGAEQISCLIGNTIDNCTLCVRNGTDIGKRCRRDTFRTSRGLAKMLRNESRC